MFETVSGACHEVVASVPVNDPSLQVADYFLWALQRLYEKKEERYWEFVWSKVSLVHDIEDVKKNEYGEYSLEVFSVVVTAVHRSLPGPLLP